MNDKRITYRQLQEFSCYLAREEKSRATIEKYMRDCYKFYEFLAGKDVTKELVIEFKRHLVEKGYAICSVNSMLVSVNSLLEFTGRSDCRVKSLKCQRQTYMSQDKELTKTEYIRLLSASKNNEQLSLILQTICSTGIRVSELKFITVEAVKKGEATVCCKNKNRIILIPGKLKNILLNYIKKRKIFSGAVFISRSRQPLDRSYIWRMMKNLCRKAGVNKAKVFPHNLRKLFARTFYAIEKDISKLADILGHSSIETTRIYIMTTCNEHRRKIEKLNLLL